MSYDLRIWEGSRPSDDAELRSVLDSLSEAEERRVLAEAAAAPPTPAVADFIEALLRRWPDCGEGGPWSSSPRQSAHGSHLYINIQWGRETEVSEFVAGLAKVWGLNCYDCQQGRLRP